MKKDFDYSTVPFDFTHCLHRQCPRSADCLRYQVTLHTTPKTWQFRVINPAPIIGKEEECPYFKPDQPIRFALGMTHLIENLPHKKAVEMKRTLLNYFKRNTYYRILNKQRLIKPKDQEFIRQLFRKNEIKEDPVFDEYIDQYEW